MQQSTSGRTYALVAGVWRRTERESLMLGSETTKSVLPRSGNETDTKLCTGRNNLLRSTSWWCGTGVWKKLQAGETVPRVKLLLR